MVSMDDDLTVRLAADLDSAFEALVVAHQDRLYAIALRVIGDPRDAEEIAQDALVRAYRALETYAADRIRALRLRPWLAAIVLNLARNRVTRRREPRAASLDQPGPDGRSLEERLPGDSGPDEPITAMEQREGVDYWAVLLAGLPVRYRIPVVLRHVDGLSFAEMSTALEKPEGTLKAQVHRGLALLRAAHEAAVRAEPQELTA